MKKVIISILLLSAVNAGFAQIISTVAGNGSIGFSGDGGVPTSAKLSSPTGVAIDGAGDLYIADNNNHRIRKVSSGTISTFAGNGTGAYGGDGAAATAAQLQNPYGICVDASGNLLIADALNNRIRKVTSGAISTFAGSGTGGFAGDGGAATATGCKLATSLARGLVVDGSGSLYIADGNRIRLVNTSGVISTIAGSTSGYTGDGGAATAAKLSGTNGVALDGSGNLYIADRNNNVVRRISTSGIISTVAGTGTAGFSGDGGAATAAQLRTPMCVALDAAGNLYISDNLNNRIRVVNGTTGIISTFAGTGTGGYSGDGGAATAANLQLPCGICFDASGSLYIADNANHRIRKVSNSAPVFDAGASSPISMCVSSGAYSLNSILAATDVNTGQTLTWSLISGPSSGSASISYSTTATGTSVTPSGLTYTPPSSSGTTSFVVRVSDGIVYDDITINVTVLPLPATIGSTSPICIGSSATFTNSVSGGTWSTSNAAIASVNASTGDVYGVSAGSATITYTNSCTYITASVSISGAISPITGIPNVCIASTTTLSDATGGGTWSSSAIGIASVDASTGVVYGVSSGSATITYSLSSGCYATATITVFSATGSITGGPHFAIGTNTTFSSSPTGGVWSSSNPSVATINSSTGDVYGLTLSVVTITYSLGGTCYTTRTIDPFTDRANPNNDEIGTAYLSLEKRLQLHPNPTTGNITIELANGCDFKVINVIGQVILSTIITSDKQDISLGKLPKGAYVVDISSKEGEKVKRIVVKD